jgi:hypothetical protein
VENICDVCRNPRRKVRPYRLAQDGDSVRVVLCKEHSKPIDDLLKLGERVPSNAPRAKVWSMEEIEKQRRAQNRRRS